MSESGPIFNGINESQPKKEINPRSMYRALAKKFHSGNPTLQQQEIMKEVNLAYEKAQGGSCYQLESLYNSYMLGQSSTDNRKGKKISINLRDIIEDIENKKVKIEFAPPEDYTKYVMQKWEIRVGQRQQTVHLNLEPSFIFSLNQDGQTKKVIFSPVRHSQGVGHLGIEIEIIRRDGSKKWYLIEKGWWKGEIPMPEQK